MISVLNVISSDMQNGVGYLVEFDLKIVDDYEFVLE